MLDQDSVRDVQWLLLALQQGEDNQKEETDQKEIAARLGILDT